MNSDEVSEFVMVLDMMIVWLSLKEKELLAGCWLMEVLIEKRNDVLI